MRTTPDRSNHLGQSPQDNSLTEKLVSEAKSTEDMVVKKVTERPMAEVMEQTGKAQEFLYIESRGDCALEDPLQKRIEMLRERSCYMHRSKGMLKPTVLG
jgi:hypothetical protein